MRCGVVLAALVVLAVPAAAAAADITTQTEDWAFTAPDALGTQADLELNARQVQLCTDEMKRLIAHRPLPGQLFQMSWVIDGLRISYAQANGVVNHVPDASWPLVDPGARSFRESIVAQGLCFGPHEITHVLTWESLWPLSWANEGFATLSDWLYHENWRCCEVTAPLMGIACDEAGWSDGGLGRRPYSDLSPGTARMPAMQRRRACGSRSTAPAASTQSGGFSLGSAPTHPSQPASSSSTT